MSDTLFPLDDYIVSHTQEIDSDIEGCAPTWRKTRQFTASDRASESDQPDKSPGKLFTPGVSSEGVSPYGDRSTHEHKFTPVWQSDCTLVNWCNCGEKRDCDTKELRESLKGCIDVRTEYRGETDKSSNNARVQEFARAVAVKDRQIAWVKCQLLERLHDLHSRIETPSYLALDEIRRDGGTQPRSAIDLKHVKLLEEQMEDGKELEPVTVFYDGESYWLADGYHRWQAHSHRGKEALACVIHQGSRRDAVLYSVGANADHKPALPRSREDKRRAVLTLLQDPEWREWSNYKIAEACRVNEKTVRNIRLSLTTDIRSEGSTRTYKTKQGTVAKMKTSNIGGKFPTSIKQKQDSNRRTEREDHPLNSCQSATITQLPSPDSASVELNTGERDLKPAVAHHLKLREGGLVEVYAPGNNKIDSRRGRIASLAERTVEVWLRDTDIMAMQKHTLKYQQVTSLPLEKEPHLKQVCDRLTKLREHGLDPFEVEILNLLERTVFLTPTELEYLAHIEQRHRITHDE